MGFGTGLVLASIALSGCYDAHFYDCTIQCTAATGCPEGLTCGLAGLCQFSEQTTCAPIPGDAGNDAAPQFSSCAGLAPTCGPAASDDCCSTATPIPGGTFDRGYDVASDGAFPDASHPATVGPFVLDKYEVTVGRFRQFVNAGMGTQTSAPAPGAGARTLNGMAAQGGWDASWNSNLSVDTPTFETDLKCSSSSRDVDGHPARRQREPADHCTSRGTRRWPSASGTVATCRPIPKRTTPRAAVTSSARIRGRALRGRSHHRLLVFELLRLRRRDEPRRERDRPRATGSSASRTSPATCGNGISTTTRVTFPTPAVLTVQNFVTAAGRIDRAGGFSYGGHSLRASYRAGVDYRPPRNYLLGVRCARPTL